MRIFVKKVRYIFEARNQPPKKILKEFQSELGFIHDVEILTKFIAATKRIDSAKQESKKTIRKKRKRLLDYISKQI